MKHCLLIIAAFLVLGCKAREESVPFRGGVLAPAIAKTDFMLTSTDGKPFSFVQRTHGYVTLLYFGYTHCPDVCPVHMANIARVLTSLPSADRARVRVVFVTTDPSRDTPEQLRAWLDNFDTSFIGLRGTPSEINDIENRLNLPPSGQDSDSGAVATPNYGVYHAAQVLAFTSDDSLRVQYPFGIEQEDWAADIPKLIAYRANR